MLHRKLYLVKQLMWRLFVCCFLDCLHRIHNDSAPLMLLYYFYYYFFFLFRLYLTLKHASLWPDSLRGIRLFFLLLLCGLLWFVLTFNGFVSKFLHNLRADWDASKFNRNAKRSVFFWWSFWLLPPSSFFFFFFWLRHPIRLNIQIIKLEFKWCFHSFYRFYGAFV